MGWEQQIREDVGNLQKRVAELEKGGGAKGTKGDKGAKGDKGDTGKDGKDGKNVAPKAKK